MSLAETAVKYLEENFTLLVDVPVDRDYIGIDIFQDEDW